MRILRLGALIALLGLLLGAAAALAEPGRSGEAVGNTEKSLSGSSEPPRSVAPRPRRSTRARQPVETRHTSPVVQPLAPARPQGFAPMGSGVISNGSCTCKDNCLRSVQLNPAGMKACVLTCQQTYAGCNKGRAR